MQNYAVLNLLSFYFRGNVDILILGIVNLFILITLMAADDETYLQFNIWFDIFGITPAV